MPILSLVGSVAGAYINLRNLDRQLEIAKATAQSRGESYELFKLRFEGGVISLLELSQNKSQYEEALASIPPLEKAIALAATAAEGGRADAAPHRRAGRQPVGL